MVKLRTIVRFRTSHGYVHAYTCKVSSWRYLCSSELVVHLLPLGDLLLSAHLGGGRRQDGVQVDGVGHRRAGGQHRHRQFVGRTAQLEAACNLFASNAVRRFRQASGDPVMAENYFQHGEHYQRIIAAANEQYRQQYGGNYGRQSFDDEDEGIAIANGTDFGLYDYVFSKDTSRAMRVSRRMRAGNVGLNTVQRNHETPFGGTKFSGVGRDGGSFGLHAYTELQSVVWPG